jgi:hypothetical protein
VIKLGKFIDLTEQRFGYLTVTRQAPHKIEKGGRSRVMWYCDCDCGNKDIAIESNNLRLGHHKTCGTRCKLRVKPNNHAAKNTVFLQYRNNALKRNMEFSLTREDVNSLIEEPCVYCGTTESNIINTDTYTYRYNGIDRIDSQKGYELGNVVTCCKYCNRAKSDMSLDEFKDWIKSVVNRLDIAI